MENDNNKISHSGHRQRMKERFLKDGNFNSFSDVNILEMILFYSIPMKDTNPIAHALLDRFGTLDCVFNASYDSLLSVPGVTPNAASFIFMIPALTKVYFDCATSQTDMISSASQAAEYLLPKFIGLTHESLYLIALNKRGKILKFSLVSNGNASSTDSDIRKIVSILLECRATAAIISHNHPNGLCVPSQNDHNVTYEIASVLSSVDIRLVDHIIISGKEHFSLASNPRFADCFLRGYDDVRFAENGSVYKTDLPMTK